MSNPTTYRLGRIPTGFERPGGTMTYPRPVIRNSDHKCVGYVDSETGGDRVSALTPDTLWNEFHFDVWQDG